MAPFQVTSNVLKDWRMYENRKKQKLFIHLFFVFYYYCTTKSLSVECAGEIILIITVAAILITCTYFIL